MKTFTILQTLGDVDPALILAASPDETAPESRRRPWRKIAALAAAVALLFTVALILPSLIGTVEPDELGDFVLPAKEKEMIWASDTADTPNQEGSMLWNGWNVSPELYTALENADGTRYLAIIVSVPGSLDSSDFVCQGMTLAQLNRKRAELDSKQEKMIDLQKEGLWLRGGDALWSEQGFGDERWAKEYYNERVAYYGEEFLATYIESGELLSDKLAADVAHGYEECAAFEETVAAWWEAYNAQGIPKDVIRQFENTGICTVKQAGRLFLFVLPHELADLVLRDKSEYFFSLAAYSLWEPGNGNVVDEPLPADSPD